MFAQSEPHGKAVAAALNRHHQRRQCGVPTISTLVGPTALSLRLFLGWAETGNRGVVSTSLENADPEMVVLHWIDELAKRLDLGVAAVHWLAHRLHRDDKVLEHALRLMTPHELDIFLESNLPLGSETSTEAAWAGI